MMATVVSEEKPEVASEERIIDLLRRTIVELQPGVETIGEHWPQLTLQQLRIMHILYCDGPTRVSTLAHRLHVSTPTVTGILDRLVQRGMTARDDDPRDRRVVLNLLTTLGMQVIEELHPIQSEHLSHLVHDLSEAERQAVATALHLLLTATSRSN
jgi:DNA-binding MarR family transcriptional regulator